MHNDGHHFLNHCQSKPLTLADLAVGDAFVVFPGDGDDHGHGGFKGGGRLHVKIEPYRPCGNYADSYRVTCREYERPDVLSGLPLSVLVLKIVGV
jgi:hypothetical protein